MLFFRVFDYTKVCFESFRRLAFAAASRLPRYRDVPDCGAVFCASSLFSAFSAPCRLRDVFAFCASSRGCRGRTPPGTTAPIGALRPPCICVSYAYSYAF